MHIIHFVLILAPLSVTIKCQMIKFVDMNPEIIKDSATVTKEWERVEYLIKYYMNEGIKAFLPLLMDDSQKLNISSTCIRDNLHLIGGLKKIKPWALRFIDSTAKSVDGLLTGTLQSFGNYDECVDTVVHNQRSGKQKGKVMFTGKYCLLKARFYLPPQNKTLKEGDIIEGLKGIYERDTALSELAKLASYFYFASVKVGMCVPSGCSVDDLNRIAKLAASYAGLYMKVKSCDVKEEPKYTPMMIFVLTFFSFTGFVVLVASLTDIYCSRYGKKPRGKFFSVLLCFSFVSNFRKLVDTSTASNNLSCLNGIRFVTMSWVLQGHFYLFSVIQVAGGLLHVKRIIETHFAFEPLINATLTVDTFFFLGGFLVCYIATKQVVIGHKKFSIVVYILHRIWRILPVLIYVILYTFIMELTATGPLARDMFSPWLESCRSYWWTPVLFINNLYRPADSCLPHTWYLAADMQLYIASLVILIPLFRWPKAGISVAAVLFVLCSMATGIDIYVNNWPPTFIFTGIDVTSYFAFMEHHYYKPYTHAPIYIIGLMTGYLLATKPNLRIPKVVQLCGWCCAVIASTSVVYGTFQWHQGRQPTLTETIIYGSFNRVAWALSLAWMVLCCATGRGGVVNYILSWKVWIPLGRLTYTGYLVHCTVIISIIASSRGYYAPRHDISALIYIGCLAMTYGVAFVISMLVEAPLLAIEKVLLQRGEEKDKDSKKDTSHVLVEGLRVNKIMDGNLSASEPHKWSENGGFVCKL